MAVYFFAMALIVFSVCLTPQLLFAITKIISVAPTFDHTVLFEDIERITLLLSIRLKASFDCNVFLKLCFVLWPFDSFNIIWALFSFYYIYRPFFLHSCSFSIPLSLILIIFSFYFFFFCFFSFLFLFFLV